LKIEGSTVLVTGASSGIGAALAPQLAERGAIVGIVARRADRLEEVLEQCRRHTPESRMWSADLGDLERAEAVALEAWDAFGGLDCLVNNAAIAKRKHTLDLTVEDVHHTMDVNFFSPIRMAMALLPRMHERGAGLIVNVSSMGGRLGIVHEAAYCAAKFAMCGWSETARIDLAGSGVEVKLVLPGRSTPRSGSRSPASSPGSTTVRSSRPPTAPPTSSVPSNATGSSSTPPQTSRAASGRRKISWWARPRTWTRSWT
jgi:short-subunit dehydrogenase